MEPNKEVEVKEEVPVSNETVQEVWPNPSCKKCYGRGWIRMIVSTKKPYKKDVLLKKHEEGQTPTMTRCGCLGTGNQEHARKMYAKIVGEEHQRGFKIQTKPS